MKSLRFVVNRIAKKKLHTGFKHWEEEVFNNMRKEKKRKLAMKIMVKSISRCLNSMLARGFAAWLKMVAFMLHEKHVKSFAAPLLRTYMLKSVKVRFFRVLLAYVTRYTSHVY